MTRKKIGIYGGTFDPIHHAHLILARQACEELDLEQLIFVPAAVSPHRDSPVASAEMRLSMLRAAIEGETAFAVDECELRRTVNACAGGRRGGQGRGPREAGPAGLDAEGAVRGHPR